MNNVYIHSILVLVLLSLTACDNRGVSDAKYQVTYTVSAVGESTISTLSYRDGNNALRTVTQPSLPWSERLTMRPGDQAWISVDGTALSGTFEVGLEAIGDDDVITLNTGCATGTDEVYPKTCNTLSVERVLP